jgi:hypothetical protein
MMKLAWGTAAILMFISCFAEAGQGAICYSSSIPLTKDNQLTNETVFSCPSLGEVTIPQIYQLGWRVTHLDLQSAGLDPNNPLNSQAAWMVLIELP